MCTDLAVFERVNIIIESLKAQKQFKLRRINQFRHDYTSFHFTEISIK